MQKRYGLLSVVLLVFIASRWLHASPQPATAQSAGLERPGDTKSLTAPPVLPAELEIVRRAKVLLSSANRWSRKDPGSCTSGAKIFTIYCALAQAGQPSDRTARDSALQEARLVVWDLVVSHEYDHPLTDYNKDVSTNFGDIQRLLRWLENRIITRLASTTRSGSGPRPDDSNANPPATPSDVRIAREALDLLSSSMAWNSRDTRDCPTGARTFSFYCAFVEASDRVIGDLQPRGAAMQEARLAVDAVAPGRKYEHRLMDFNNDPTVGYAGVLSALRAVEARLRERVAAGT